MRPDGVVVPPPGLDQFSGFCQGVEDLAVQELVTHRAVEGLAGVVTFLASPAASFITGQNIVADGGTLITDGS